MPPAMVVLHSKQGRLLGAGLSKALRNTITIKMVMGIVFFFAGMSIVYVKQRVGLSLAGAGLVLVFVPAEFLFGVCVDFKGKKGSRTNSVARLSQVSVKVEDGGTRTSSALDIRSDPLEDVTSPSRRTSVAGCGVLPSRPESQTARFHRTRSAVLRYEPESTNPRRFHRTQSAVLQSSDFTRSGGQLETCVDGPESNKTMVRCESLRSKRRHFQRTRAVSEDESSSGQPYKTALRDSTTTSPRKTVRLQEAYNEALERSQTSWATENYTRFHRIRAAMQAAEVQKARAARAGGRPELQKASSLTSSSLPGSYTQLRSTRTTTVTLSASHKTVTVRQSSDICLMSREGGRDLQRTWSGPSGRPATGSGPGEGPAQPWASVAIRRTVTGVVTLLWGARNSSTSSGSTESEPRATEDCGPDKAVHRESTVESVPDRTPNVDNNEAQGEERKWWDNGSQESAGAQVFDLAQQSDETSDAE